MSYFNNIDTEHELKHQFRMYIIKYGNDSPDFDPQLLQAIYEEYKEILQDIMSREDYISPRDFIDFMVEEDRKERKALRQQRFLDIFRNKDEKLFKRTFLAVKSLFQPVEHVSWGVRAQMHQQKLKEEEQARLKAAEEGQPAETVPAKGQPAETV